MHLLENKLFDGRFQLRGVMRRVDAFAYETVSRATSNKTLILCRPTMRRTSLSPLASASEMFWSVYEIASLT